MLGNFVVFVVCVCIFMNVVAECSEMKMDSTEDDGGDLARTRVKT